MVRNCDGCTKCCDGWLSGSVRGKDFHPNQPCYFRGDGCCSIYDERPENPCRTFKCEWLLNEDYPEWMKPSVSNSLHLVLSYEDGMGNVHKYLRILETGGPITNEVLFFCMTQYVKTGMPMKIQLNGCFHNFGPPGFEYVR